MSEFVERLINEFESDLKDLLESNETGKDFNELYSSMIQSQLMLFDELESYQDQLLVMGIDNTDYKNEVKQLNSDINFLQCYIEGRS